jgi:hypothetical protein
VDLLVLEANKEASSKVTRVAVEGEAEGAEGEGGKVQVGSLVCDAVGVSL